MKQGKFELQKEGVKIAELSLKEVQAIVKKDVKENHGKTISAIATVDTFINVEGSSVVLHYVVSSPAVTGAVQLR